MSYKVIDFTKTGGLYTYQDTLAYMQDSYAQVGDAIAAFFGDKVIVAGCVVTGGNISSGWVVLNGELLPVVGGSLLTHVYVDQLPNAERLEQFDNGTQQVVYSRRQLQFTNTSSGNTAWSLFKRVPFNASTLLEAFTKIQTIIKNTVNVEAAVIIQGCVVSAVTGTTSGTCTISAGIVLMDGEYVTAPLRTAGAFPCWLKPDGTYVTSDPGGTNVLFNYETSQRYKHVMKRYMHESGEIVMSVATADQALFDVATGLGKWKWLGWKLSEDMRGRVPVGIDVRTSDPSDGVWDANYNDVNNQGGEKEHTLTDDEMPSHSHDVSEIGDSNPDVVGTYRAIASNSDGAPGTFDIKMKDAGGDDPHNNVQPYNVVLFIERI